MLLTLTSKHPVVISSIPPSTKADSLCPVTQDRACLWGTVVSFVSISCLTFPRPALVPWHAYSVGKQPNHPSSQWPDFYPHSQSAIHSFIYPSSGWLLVPPSGPEQGLSLGDSSWLCSPPLMPHIPQTCPGSPLKAEATGRGMGLLTPPSSRSFSDIITV